jgi:DNA (cytosine-5)-methyltransferase 3A
MGVRVLSLFDGIACGRLALHQLAIPVTSYKAAEIEKHAITIARSNFPDIEHVGDVTQLQVGRGECDLLLAGSPCQGFSCSGKRLNFDDPRSKLFWEFVRILTEAKPRYFFLENSLMQPAWADIISEAVGCQPLRIDAGIISAQHRDRLYWTNIFGACVPIPNPKFLSEIVGAYDKKIWIYPRGHTNKGVYDYHDKCPTITTAGWDRNFFYLRNGEKVKFTPEQAEEIQGLPVGYTSSVSRSTRFTKIGNGWSMPVIEHLFRGLKDVASSDPA